MIVETSRMSAAMRTTLHSPHWVESSPRSDLKVGKWSGAPVRRGWRFQVATSSRSGRLAGIRRPGLLSRQDRIAASWLATS